MSYPDYTELHYVSHRKLELTPQTADLLEKTGIPSIGDCLDYITSKNWNGTMIEIRRDIDEVMLTEVTDKLKEKGYWSIIAEYINSAD